MKTNYNILVILYYDLLVCYISKAFFFFDNKKMQGLITMISTESAFSYNLKSLRWLEGIKIRVVFKALSTLSLDQDRLHFLIIFFWSSTLPKKTTMHWRPLKFPKRILRFLGYLHFWLRNWIIPFGRVFFIFFSFSSCEGNFDGPNFYFLSLKKKIITYILRSRRISLC